ncbi:MAG: hypothetical protein IJA85_11970 [Clostridia bacterium]|nr:hypothetical protein [Clostridia bacterium]
MLKRNRCMLLFTALMVLFCSCAPDAAPPVIDADNVQKLTVIKEYPQQEVYSIIPAEILDLLAAVNELIAMQEIPVQPDVDSLPDDMLHMTLEQKDGSLVMLNLYILSDDIGILRCINHTADDIQTVIVSFEFQNSDLIRAVRHIQSK